MYQIYNTENLNGKYVDVVSLYPTVNKYDKYRVGHPIKKIGVSPSEYFLHSASDNKLGKYYGIIKCKILAPKELLYPVLPYKQKTKDVIIFVSQDVKMMKNVKPKYNM